jgi:hypothetical protein
MAACTVSALRFALRNVVASRVLVEAAAAAEQRAAGAPIEIDVQPGLQENWFGYLLRKQRIRFHQRNALLPVDTPPLGQAAQLEVRQRGIEAERDTASASLDFGPEFASVVWSNDKYELLASIDVALASVELPALPWRAGAILRLAIDPVLKVLRAETGAASQRIAFAGGTPRTLQALLAVRAPVQVRSASGGSAELSFTPGVWLLDLDLACGEPPGFGVDDEGVTLVALRVLANPTGRAGQCVEARAQRTGVVALRRSIAGSVIRSEVEVVSPPDRTDSPLRLGLHVRASDGAQSAWLGVWSVDLPAGSGLHRAVLAVDLERLTATAQVDGRATPVAVANLELDRGSLLADTVLWQLAPVAKLVGISTPGGERHPDGSVELPLLPTSERLQLLPDP